MRNLLFLLACCAALSVTNIVAAAQSKPATAPTSHALSPDEALKSFELEPGLKVDLVAAEPLVESPCAVCWDEQGRMFVCENRGYPLGGPGGKPVGVVAMLEDTNGDGLPDKRTEFAAGFTFPNGIMPWRGGVIVTCAPDVFFLKDTDNDGKADVRDVMLTGFSVLQTTQLRVNHPRLAPDGWIYFAGGLVGGKVHSTKHPEKVLDTLKHDVRFKPETGEIELMDGQAQYGLTFDDAGHRFVCFNRVQVQHAPLPAQYLARNPRVTSPGVLQNCPDLVKNLMLGLSSDAGARIFPISSNLTTADSHAGTYSAACSVHIARGDSLPPEYIGKAWSADPTGNLVRYDELVPTGGSFHAKRVRDNTEAFRSRDDWFRPVDLSDGPDGALYVCDMYRKTIEHPEYLPEEVAKRTDFESGRNMGRIWRISRTDATPPQLAEAAKKSLALFANDHSDKKLLDAMKSPNGWDRDTAFRLATEKGEYWVGMSTKRFLLSDDSKSASPATVIACMNLLNNNNALTPEIVFKGLKNKAPIVREVSVRFADPQLALAMAHDNNVHVRYAAALAIGDIGGADKQPAGVVVDALAWIAERDADDKWVRAALLSSLPAAEDQWQFLSKIAKQQGGEGRLLLLQELARLRATDPQSTDAAVTFDRLWHEAQSCNFKTRAALLVGYAERGGAPADELRKRLRDNSAPGLKETFAEAGLLATFDALGIDLRLQAVDLLALADDPSTAEILTSLIAPAQPSELAIAAIRALAQPHRAAGGVITKLLTADRWNHYSPALRTTLLTSIVGRPEHAQALVDALETKSVPGSALAEPQRKWLRELKDESLKPRIAKLLENTAPGDRKKAYDDTAKACLSLPAHPDAGKRVFANNCASCHRLEQQGVAVGPDLYGIRNQPKESILLHIVIPEQEIASNFAAYNCELTDGRTITGIMTADSPASVTLRQVLGLDETIPRDKIKSLTVSPLSLMPQGLEKAIKPQEMADLIAYLRGE